MHKAIVKFMVAVGITTYIPTPEDYARLDFLGRPTPADADSKVEDLVLKSYGFDHYYDYSDDIQVFRRGRDQSKSLVEQFAELEDQELGKFLLDTFKPGQRDVMEERFPWLKGRTVHSHYADLVIGGLTPLEAANVMAVRKFLFDQDQIIAKRGLHSRTVYAKDMRQVLNHIREARELEQEPLARPVSIPANLLSNWKHIGELLEAKGVYTLLKASVPLQVLYHGNLTRYTVGGVTLFM